MSDSYELKEKLAQFCDAIRSKENWVFKILDDTQGLGTKWATEANLLQPNDDSSDESNPVVMTLQYVTVIFCQGVVDVDFAR